MEFLLNNIGKIMIGMGVIFFISVFILTGQISTEIDKQCPKGFMYCLGEGASNFNKGLSTEEH